MLKDFQKFLLRGNVVDLAVGVVIGAAFGTIVTSMVTDLLTPLIAAVARVPNFSGLAFYINHSQFMYGDFLNSLISFILVAATVFFFVVKPMNVLVARMHRDDAPVDPTTKKCPQCVSEIPIAATRCSQCTQVVG